jgi:FixJ family two-component response regulator
MPPSTLVDDRQDTALQQATVFIVDDDADVRKSISLLVRSVDLNCETYSSGNDFLASHDPVRPGCLVLDVRMPGLTGLELQRELRSHAVEMPIIFVSAHGEIPMVIQSLRAGALDFLQKPFSPQAMLERIHEAIVEDARRRRSKSQRVEVERRLAQLSIREREILGLLADGLSTKSIAAHLSISSKTVDNHRARIFEKIQVDNTAELVRLIYSRAIRL